MSFDRPTLQISSAQNPRIKDVVRLRSERHRKKQNKILIDGIREIERAVQSGFQIEELYCCENLSQSENRSLPDWTNESGAKIFELTKNVFEKICFGQRNEGLIAVAAERQIQLEELQLGANPLIIILDGIEKPGNIGAVFRTAAAAGVEAILITNEVSHPFNANSIRASLGTVFELPFVSTTYQQAISFFDSCGVQVVTTRVDGSTDYSDFNFSGPTAIVMGSEADGISGEWSDEASITIPMHRSVDSLNISASTAIIAFEAHRQRKVSHS